MTESSLVADGGWGGRLTKPEKEYICSLSWLWQWFHGCKHWPKLSRLYIFNMSRFVYSNFSEIKMLKNSRVSPEALKEPDSSGQAPFSQPCVTCGWPWGKGGEVSWVCHSGTWQIFNPTWFHSSLLFLIITFWHLWQAWWLKYISKWHRDASRIPPVCLELGYCGKAFCPGLVREAVPHVERWGDPWS